MGDERNLEENGRGRGTNLGSSPSRVCGPAGALSGGWIPAECPGYFEETMIKAEAVEAAAAVEQYLIEKRLLWSRGCRVTLLYFSHKKSLAAIIVEKMALAIEAAYKEGVEEGAAQWRKYLGEDVIDACWRDSRAFAALGLTVEVKT